MANAPVQRMSQLMAKTLRDDPADAEVLSHKLLVRAGYVRRTAAGIWSWLPLGKKVLANVERIVREEMDAIGAQEVLLPALLPREPYEATGRWDEYGPELFRLQDRRGGDYLLGPTHEEIFTLIVKDQASSYKDLPVILYQIQTKYRDEARPRAGILRGREFLMKDSYSFDTEDEGLAQSYALHREAYQKVFERLGLDYRICAATAGAMGGSKSEEFLAPAERRRGHLRGLPELRLRGQHRGDRVRAEAGGRRRRGRPRGDPAPRTPRPSRRSPRTSASRPPPPSRTSS